MSHIPDESNLITKIRSRDDEAFIYIRKECYDIVHKIVTTNSGSAEDAEDLYLEGIIGLINWFDQPVVEMTCKVTSLFITICKNQWLLVLAKRRTEKKHAESETQEFYEEEFEEKIDKELFDTILWECFSKLKNECKIILKGYMKEMKVKDLAALLDISTSNLKKKKFYCHKHLIKMISEHPDYKKMKENNEINLPNS